MTNFKFLIVKLLKHLVILFSIIFINFTASYNRRFRIFFNNFLIEKIKLFLKNQWINLLNQYILLVVHYLEVNLLASFFNSSLYTAVRCHAVVVQAQVQRSDKRVRRISVIGDPDVPCSVSRGRTSAVTDHPPRANLLSFKHAYMCSRR